MIKVICINNLGDIFVKNKIYDAEYFNFLNKGICLNEPKEDYIDVHSSDGEVKVAFYLDKQYQKWNKFSDHFLTIAEWRDKQINDILND